MKKLSLLFLTTLTILFTSCKDNQTQQEPEVVTVDNTEVKVYEIAQKEAEFNDPKVEAIFEQYIEVEEALVNTDAARTTSESVKLELLLKEVNADETTLTAVSAMATSDDIKVQRQHFEALSSGMETMLKGAISSGMLYKQYCPMAFNNKGAYWISSSKDILNPYFGDVMLKCGRVDAEVK
jgi:hypothetical protein